MPPIRLPIVQPAPTGDLLRLALRARESFSAALTEPMALDCGTAYASAEFPLLPEANCVYIGDGAPGDGPAALAEITAAFSARHLLCRQIHWPSAPTNPPLPPAYRLSEEVLLRMATPAFPSEPDPDLTIIPGRAAFSLLRRLVESAGRASGAADSELLTQTAAAADRFLDDPHIDNLLALSKDDPPLPVGTLYLAPAGQALLIDKLSVHPDHAGRGIDITLLRHAVDLAARSRARHLLLFCDCADPGALPLCESLGFTAIAARHTLALLAP